MTLQYNYDKATSKWREYDGKLKKFGSEAPPILQTALSAQFPEAMTIDTSSPSPGVKGLAQKAQKQNHVNNVRVKPGNRRNPNPTIVNFQGKNYGYDVTFRGGGRWREVNPDGYFGKTARSDINYRLSQIYFPQFNILPGSPLQVPKQPRKVIQGLPMFKKSQGGNLPSKDVKGKLNITGGSEGSTGPVGQYKRPEVIIPPPAKGTPGKLNISVPGQSMYNIPKGRDNGTDPSIKLPLPPPPPKNTPKEETKKKVEDTNRSFFNFFRGRKNSGNGGVNGGPTNPSGVNSGAPRSAVKRNAATGEKVGSSQFLSRIASNTEYTNVVLTAILRYFRRNETEESIEHEFKRAKEIEGKKGKLSKVPGKKKSKIFSGSSGGGDLLATGLGSLLGAGAIAASVWAMLPEETRTKITEKIKTFFSDVLKSGLELLGADATAMMKDFKGYLKELGARAVDPDRDRHVAEKKQIEEGRKNAIGFTEVPTTKNPGESDKDFYKRKLNAENNLLFYRHSLPQNHPDRIAPNDKDSEETYQRLLKDPTYDHNDPDKIQAINDPLREVGMANEKAMRERLKGGKSASKVAKDKAKDEKTYSKDLAVGADGKVDGNELLEYIKSQGVDDTLARAMVGNFSAESDLRPDLEHDDGGKPAYGLGQWRETRYEALKRFAADHNQKVSDPRTQVAFALQEKDFRRTKQEINRTGAKDQDAVTKIFRHRFENPAKDKKTGKLLGIDKAQQFARNLGPTPRSEGTAVENRTNEVAPSSGATTVIAPQQQTTVNNNYMGNKNGGGQVASPINDEPSYRASQSIR